MITAIKFVSIPSRDQDAALSFWTEKVGFSIVSDQPFDQKQRWIELAVHNSSTRLVLFTPEGQEERIGGFFNGAFACDDVDATHRQLTERGVEFAGPPKQEPWGKFAIFKDPEGNQFVISAR
jgi:predicted enzyme related to lactoylglutathione lyase